MRLAFDVINFKSRGSAKQRLYTTSRLATVRKLLNIGNPNGDDDGAQFACFRSAAKRARSREDTHPRANRRLVGTTRVKLISSGIVVI